MRRLNLLRLSLWTYIAGGCVIAALSILVPLGIERLFWGTEESVYTTQYVFGAYMAFFLIVLGIFIPIIRWFFGSLKRTHTHPIDVFLTFVIFVASAVPLILIVAVTIPALRSKRLARYKYRIYNFTASASLFLAGAPLRYYGYVRKKKDGPVFIIINHSNSIVDYIGGTLCAGTEPFTVLAGANLGYNTSTFGDWIISKTIGPVVKEHAIAINRDDPASRVASTRAMIKAIDEKKNIVAFPEGTRLQVADMVKNGTILQPFQDGVFYVAWKKKVPIQPVVFDWPMIWRGKNDPRFGFRPTTVQVHLGELVDPTQFSSVEELRDHCWNIMYGKLKESKRVQKFLSTF